MARRYGGTGLGLVITKQLVELMGGDLTVESQDGVGSTFRFRLPISPRSITAIEFKEGAAVSDSHAVARSAAPAMLGVRVLVVEDNLVNQEVATAMLEIMGCEVTLASSGVEALEALTVAEFDIVLMDCQMPGMDGFETVARFRAGPSDHYAFVNRSRLPIVAVTANNLVGDAERCIAAGFDDYLAKPFSQHQLELLIARGLGRAT
jgi:CheY-like chemotaxis protein